MKKTMIFENEFDYDNWFEANEEKEGGHDFIEDRVVIVKGTRTIQNRKFNGFSADATINCKNVKTAIRRFIKELKSNGFNVSEDEFESNVHCFTDCGYVVEIEEIDEDRFYINYMCYQNEVEEEATEPETAEEPKAEGPETATAEATTEKVWTVTQFPHVVRTFDKSGKMIYESFFETAEKAYDEYEDIIENEKENLPYGRELIVARFADGILMCRETIKGTCIYPNMRFVKKVTKDTAETPTPTPTPTAHTKSLLNSAYGITAERETATDHTYEIRVFKNGVFICSRTFSLESFAETAFSIMEMNAIDFSEPCFNVIELFKGGKLVKMSSIYFGKIVLEVKK